MVLSPRLGEPGASTLESGIRGLLLIHDRNRAAKQSINSRLGGRRAVSSSERRPTGRPGPPSPWSGTGPPMTPPAGKDRTRRACPDIPARWPAAGARSGQRGAPRSVARTNGGDRDQLRRTMGRAGQPLARRRRRSAQAPFTTLAGGETPELVNGPTRRRCRYGGRLPRHPAPSLAPGPSSRGQSERRQMTRQTPKSNKSAWVPPATTPVQPTAQSQHTSQHAVTHRASPATPLTTLDMTYSQLVPDAHFPFRDPGFEEFDYG